MNSKAAPQQVALQFRCTCGHRLRAEPGHSKPWVWVCSREGGGLDVIQRNADAHGLDWHKLIDDPLLLGPPLTPQLRPNNREVEALPSPAWFRRCAVRLRRSPAPLAWLQTDRRVSLAALRLAGVGWNGERLLFPMRYQGELVAFKTRAPRSGAQMICCPGSGRPWPLYPRVPREEGWVLLVEGELDALCGLSHGLPVCSITLGVGTWRYDWMHELRGLRVAVCFDNDAQRWAMKRIAALQAVGIDACRVRLPRRLGPKGDLSDYLRQGGDPEHLRRTRQGEPHD